MNTGGLSKERLDRMHEVMAGHVEPQDRNSAEPYQSEIILTFPPKNAMSTLV